MMKYLKLFETDSARVEYEGSEDYLEPYVSYVEGDNSVHYNKVETRLIVTYNVEDASNPTQLYLYMNQQGMPFTVLGADMFSKVEIDGTEVAVADLDTAQGQYQFSAGEHTVKYTLKDPEFIGAEINEEGEAVVITRLGATFAACPITSVEIPNTVTSIGGGAFQSCGSLTSVTIPDSVTNIGSAVFDGCSSLPIVDNIRYADTYAIETVDRTLTTYSIKSGTKWIGNFAFQDCYNLASITIPDSVTSIGASAFQDCYNLASITIPDSVTSIGDYAFQYCSSLSSITIPDAVTSIGDRTFEYCSGLTSVAIPNSVTSIGEYAFLQCTNLTSVTIPNSVTSIGEHAFEGCSGLTSISVDSNNTVYDSRNNCNAIIETATNTLISGCKNTIIPNTVTSIGEYAFTDCSSLTSVTIPDSVTSIGEYAFAGCSGLTNVIIPNSVIGIGDYAFQYCSSLSSVTIGNSVTSIGDNAFNSCRSLTSITSLASIAPTILSNTFRDVKTNGTLTVLSGSSGYDTWMGTGNYYLGKYGWTKVEQ